jgi:hypothetical protein
MLADALDGRPVLEKAALQFPATIAAALRTMIVLPSAFA